MPLMDFHDRYPDLVDGLCKARLTGKDFHSLIFKGDNLKEVMDFAQMWLQACVCTNSLATGDACGECSNCSLLVRGRYPYLFKIEPTSKSRQILVDEIRDLERSLYLTSGGEKKIALIIEADRMVNQAQNAFLKTLEEPPSNTLLLLLTIKEEALLPTIRSRCQILSLFRNRFEYSFQGAEKLFPILWTMNSGKGALVASAAGQQLIDLLATLQKEAENNVQHEMEDQQSNEVFSGSSSQKKSDSKVSAQIASRYLSYRDQLISLIHAWYAQEFMRADGISIDLLPYPQFYDDVPETRQKKEPDKQNVLKNLKLCDELIVNSKFNIAEQLMILDFCHKICAKSGIRC